MTEPATAAHLYPDLNHVIAGHLQAAAIDAEIATMSEPTPPALTAAQEEAITRIAAMPPGVGRHAAFLRCVLGEKSYFDIALMSRWMRNDEPLTEAEMRYIAERWHVREPA